MKLIKLLIDLDPGDLEDAQNIGGNGGQKKEDVKNKLNEWHDWLVDYVPKPNKNAAGIVY